MSAVVIKVENISKQYRLGQVDTGSLSHDINRVWYKLRGKADPYLKIGEENTVPSKNNSDYVWALKDVCFDVKQGEVLGIIGKNGAGKSTLLKILSRTTLPTIGKIKTKGRVASLLEVGTGFHPDLTGRDNIFLNGAILGMNKKEITSKFDEIVDFSGVERYIDTPVKRYSSGMYVRLAFAVAAHLHSEILVVDEVLAVGDAEFQKKCLGRMKEVSRGQGRTVLFVSHNMAAVENLCTTGLVLNNGSVYSISDNTSAIQTYLALNASDISDKPLLTRTDRQGNGFTRFTDVQFLDASTREIISTAMSGQNIILRLYLSESEANISNAHVAVGINDMLDNRVAHLSNELTNEINYDCESGMEYIDILIRKLPLNAGVYNLTLYMAINGVVCDWIQNACYLNIETGDFYKTGKTIPGNAGSFLLDYQFSYKGRLSFQ